MIKRGHIFFASLDPVIGHEQGHTRPVLILQNDIGNYYSPTTIVACISSKVTTKSEMPTHYLLFESTGLKVKSFVLLEHIRTIDKSRLLTYVGKVSENDMRQIERCILISLGL